MCRFSSAQSFLDNTNSLFYLKNFSVKDGLSESNVNAIIKDRKGIVWIGTDGGLNRFNSYDFEVFLHDTSQNSISSNVIYDIVEDEHGSIWIGTSNGLNLFVPETNEFKRYFYKENTEIEKMVYDPNTSSLWLAMIDNGLVQFDVNQGTFTRNELLPRDILVQRLLFVDNDSLIVGSRTNGLFQINLKSKRINQINEQTSDIALSNSAIQSLSILDNLLVVGTNNGVNLIDFENRQNKILSKSRSNFSADLIVCSAIDEFGNIWIGTDGGGINMITYPELKITNFRKNDMSEYFLQSDVIREIFIDNEKNIWFGTFKKGFGIQSNNSGYLKNVKLDQTVVADLGGNSVTSFDVDDTQNMLIGLDGGGVMRWNGDSFERIYLEPRCRSCNDQKVMSLRFDDEQNLWVGTYAGGIFCVEKTGNVQRYRAENTEGILSNYIWAIKKDKKGNLWFATESGLTRYDTYSKSWKTFMPKSEVDSVSSKDLRTMIVRSDGQIVVGGFFGFFTFSPAKEEFAKHFSMQNKQLPLAGNVIISIEELQNGNIVIGTYGQGFQIIDLEKNKFANLDISHRIGSEVINFIQEDAEGDLWVGTNRGIATINPGENNFTWFNTNNGLQDDVFNLGSGFLLGDTLLFAGGLNGFSFINTRKLKAQANNPEILLEKVSYRNEFLKFNPYETENIPVFTIAYSKSSLHFNFTALEFFNSSNVNFSYRLKNFDDNWSEPSRHRMASYTNIPPGSYDFIVKTSMYRNESNSPVNLARVIVKPAWWMTFWFRFGIFIIFVSIVYLIIKFRTDGHKKAEKRLLEAVREKTSEIARQKGELENINLKLEDIVKHRTRELNDTINELNKTISELDRFVYSASHDLGAPLKSILGLINIAKLETKDENIRPHLDFMHESVKRLEDVIGSLIQFSRNSRLEPEISQINLYDLIEDSYDALRFMHGHEEIHFMNEIDENSVVHSDEGRLKVIIRNILSNAVKYADREKANKWIKVVYKNLNRKKWVLEIIDNGIGIESIHKEKIFKMFYRANDHADGSGLGLYIAKEAITKLEGEISIQSELGRGTSVEISMNNLS